MLQAQASEPDQRLVAADLPRRKHHRTVQRHKDSRYQKIMDHLCCYIHNSRQTGPLRRNALATRISRQLPSHQYLFGPALSPTRILSHGKQRQTMDGPEMTFGLLLLQWADNLHVMVRVPVMAFM